MKKRVTDNFAILGMSRGGRATRSDEKKPIYFDRKILRSEAYRALEGEVAPKYLVELLGRRQMHYIKARKKWTAKNNGQIVFPYADGLRLFGVSSGRHLRALRELNAKGFIDVTHFGGGMEGDATTFAMSNRWKQYGRPDFQESEWAKDKRKKGNSKIALCGRGRKIKHNHN